MEFGNLRCKFLLWRSLLLFYCGCTSGIVVPAGVGCNDFEFQHSLDERLALENELDELLAAKQLLVQSFDLKKVSHVAR